jgi:hypothetical protein
MAWTEWADELVGELRSEPPSNASLPATVMEDLGRYVRRWKPPKGGGDTWRWLAETDPDELEYLVHALFRVDVRLSAEVLRGERADAPHTGRAFYLVLVRALLHALEMESPARAAFVDQLRSSWPIAAQAS